MFFHLIAEPLKFLSRDLVNISLAAISFWQYLGFYMVVFLAGLQTIPPDYYEASKVDGASFWQDLFYITIPNLIPIIELAMFLVISGSLKVFDFPFVLTRGGPNGASDTLATKSIQLAFQFNDYGTAAGLSVIMVVIIIVITLIQRKLLNTKE
jgi:multiple sugar transport system permease protein